MAPTTIELERARAIYREAIDSKASSFEGAAWWRAVASEIDQVLTASTEAEAAAVIAWWHADWTEVSDTPADAVARIRAAGAVQ